MTTSNSLFTVLRNGNALVVTKTVGGLQQTLCVLDRRHQPSFYLSLGHVVCRDANGREFTLMTETPDEANELLTTLMATQVAKFPHRFYGTWKGNALFLAFVTALLVAGGTWLHFDVPPVDVTSPVIKPALGAAKMPPAVETSTALPTPAAPDAANFSPAMVATPANGWTLPESIQKTLPEKLHKASERKLFTVNYSSGHARTLYVFADPSCPNCQRVEPLLQGAASQYNVVVFPVAVIGREQSIASITPVLCLPPEQRKAAWMSLFDVGHGALEMGKTPAAEQVQPDPSQCGDAEKALAINEVAYKAYRIPGTPWVISDDGRHVSQALLSDPARLQAFISEQEPTDAPK